MRLVTHCMNAAGIDPPVIKIEERTDGQGVVNRLVAVARLVQHSHIRRTNVDGVLIDLSNKSEEGLFPIGESGRLRIPDHAFHQFQIIQQFRRDRGVRLQSKGALIEAGSVGRN